MALCGDSHTVSLGGRSLLLVAALAVCRVGAGELPKTAGWVEARTDHFTLYSSAGSQETRKIAVELERFREALGRMTQGFELAGVPTAVYVFRNDAQFAPYRFVEDGRPANVSGYLSQRAFRNYVAFDASTPAGLRVVFHEHVHAVVHRTFSAIPSWLNEGLAEFYSTFRFNDLANDAEVGRPIDEHVQRLNADGLMDVAELFSSKTPVHDEAGRQGRFYAQSWLLVHYLMLEDTRRTRLGRLLTRLKEGAAPDEAVAAALEADPASLQGALRQYLRSGGGGFNLRFDDPIEKQPVMLRTLAPGEVLYRLGDLLAQLGPPSTGAARAHLEAALAQGGPAAAIHSVLGAVAQERHDLAEADAQHRRATESAGADAEAFARRGAFLLQRFETQGFDGSYAAAEVPAAVLEARALLQKSMALDPDGVEALAALGRTFLFGPDGASEGLIALGRANALRPDRVDVLHDLVCMLAKSGRTTAAWSLLKNQLAPRAPDPVWVGDAERWIVKYEVEAVKERLEGKDVDGAMAMLSEIEVRITDEALRTEVAAFRRRLANPALAGGRATIVSVSGEAEAGIVEEYSRAAGLLEEGKPEEALAQLERTLESCTADELCAQIRSTVDSLRAMIEHNRIVAGVNEAIELLRAGQRKAAIEKLRALERESTDPALTESIRSLLEQVGAR